MAVAPDNTFIQTVIRNTSGATRVFGYLPPHGKSLTNNQDYTFDGDLEIYLMSVSRKNKRKFDHFKSDITNGYIQMTKVSHRPEIAYYPVGATFVVAAGDLVYWDSGNSSARSAADFTWTTDLPTTQGNFANVFIGVAQQAHASGTAGTIAVDISPNSIYTISCTSQTNNPGDMYGPDKAAGNALLPQQIVKTATAADAIARAVGSNTSSLSVAVRIQSAYWGANAAAQQ